MVFKYFSPAPQMSIRLKVQIVREGTKYESYRLTLPRSLIHAHDLRGKDFDLTIRNGDLVLTPVENSYAEHECA